MANWKRRIVVVEDETLVATLIAELPTQQAFEVQTANSAAEARQVISSFDLDAALIDIHLGAGPYGLHLGHVLRQSHPQMGIVFLSRFTDPVGRFLAFLPVVIIALVLAIARTVSFARASIIDELHSTNAELQWEVARIRLHLWAQQRRFAQAIHGPLQAAITASALLLTSDDDSDRQAAIDAAPARIKSALDNLIVHQDSAVDLTSGLNEIEQTWEGVCHVLTHVSPAAHDLLEGDDTCRQATVMVVGESVANAAIHGKATHTRVDVAVDHARYVQVSVHDNGTGNDNTITTGLGSAILDEACAERDLVNTADGAQLTALLACSSPDPTHSTQPKVNPERIVDAPHFECRDDY